MSDHDRDAAPTWFQRHPKKTLVAVTLLSILVIVYVAEKFLEFNNHRHGIFLEAD